MNEERKRLDSDDDESQKTEKEEPPSNLSTPDKTKPRPNYSGNSTQYPYSSSLNNRQRSANNYNDAGKFNNQKRSLAQHAQYEGYPQQFNMKSQNDLSRGFPEGTRVSDVLSQLIRFNKYLHRRA